MKHKFYCLMLAALTLIISACASTAGYAPQVLTQPTQTNGIFSLVYTMPSHENNTTWFQISSKQANGEYLQYRTIPLNPVEESDDHSGTNKFYPNSKVRLVALNLPVGDYRIDRLIIKSEGLIHVSPNINLAFNIQTNGATFLGNYHLSTNRKIDISSRPLKSNLVAAQLTRNAHTGLDLEQLNKKFPLLKKMQHHQISLIEGTIFAGELTPTGNAYNFRHQHIIILH